MKYPPSIFIQAATLPEAYGNAIQDVLKKGMVIGTQYGTRSKDVCSMIEITHPYDQPMMHPDFPTKELHTQEYLKQWERDYNWIKQGHEYNYMDRLTHNPKPRIECDTEHLEAEERIEGRIGVQPHYYNHVFDPSFEKPDHFIDQIAEIRDKINRGVSRRLQATTWIPARDLFVDADQPCLQRLWLRNLGDGNAELHSMWRSRDLYAAWNSNMVGLLTMVDREILQPNKMRLIKVIDFCNSLHIYEADWEVAKLVKVLPRNPMYGVR